MRRSQNSKASGIRNLVEARLSLKFGHFARTATSVLLTRAEGPAENSHARKGVVGGIDEFEGRRPGTKAVSHLRRSLLMHLQFPASPAGPTHCRPSGLNQFSDTVLPKFCNSLCDPCRGRSSYGACRLLLLHPRSRIPPIGPPCDDGFPLRRLGVPTANSCRQSRVQ